MVGVPNVATLSNCGEPPINMTTPDQKGVIPRKVEGREDSRSEVPIRLYTRKSVRDQV